MDIVKSALRKLGRTLCISLLLVAAVAVLCIIYGFIADRRFMIAYVFTGNFAVGTLLIVGSIVVHLLPSRQDMRIRNDKLIDLPAYKEARMGERKNPWKGNNVLYIGIATIFLTAVFELLVWLLAAS